MTFCNIFPKIQSIFCLQWRVQEDSSELVKIFIAHMILTLRMYSKIYRRSDATKTLARFYLSDIIILSPIVSLSCITQNMAINKVQTK